MASKGKATRLSPPWRHFDRRKSEEPREENPRGSLKTARLEAITSWGMSLPSERSLFVDRRGGGVAELVVEADPQSVKPQFDVVIENRVEGAEQVVKDSGAIRHVP
jgi:hypothetical protein